MDGSSVEDFIQSGVLSGQPSVVKTITNRFDTFTADDTDDHGDQYGSRIRGWVQVPVTGSYKLFLSSDNASQLSFSTNHEAVNAVIIAQETNGTAPLFGEDRLEQRTSPPLTLEKGRSYYLEVLHKESSGSDYVRVGWQTPLGAREIIPALYLLPFDADVPTATFVEEPEASSAVEGTRAVLTATVRVQQPATFKWLKDGVPIEEENVQSLVLDEVQQMDAGQYRLDVTGPDNYPVSSGTVALSVLPDTFSPTVVKAELNSKSNSLTIAFSEKVDPASSTNSADYHLNNGVTLSNPTLGTDKRTVTLIAAGVAPGQSNFTLSVTGVADRYGNVIAPAETPIILTWTETFHRGPGHFTEANNNHTNGSDFDYSFSINAGGNVGEIGGSLARTTSAAAAYKADPTLGTPVSLTNNLVLRGNLYLHNIAANGNFFLGFAPATNDLSSLLGISWAEPNSSSAPNFRGFLLAVGVSSAQFSLPQDEVVAFDLFWDALTGVLSGAVGNQTVTVSNGPAATVYTTFLATAYGANSIRPAQNLVLYLDNLTYSIGSTRTFPPETGPTVGVTLQEPVAGELFQLGSSASLSAQALSSAEPVQKVDFVATGQSGGSETSIGEDNNAPYATTWAPSTAGKYALYARATTTDSVSATSAAVAVRFVTVPSLVLAIEPFSNAAGRFQTKVNNHTGGYNFDFSNTANAAGDLQGEIGGLFVRDPLPAYIADTNVGELFPRFHDVSFSGKLTLQNSGYNGGLFGGYVNAANLGTRFGISISEPGGSSGGAFRASVVLGSASSGTINLPDQTPLTFSLHWSAESNSVTGTLAGQPVSFSYVPRTEVLDALIVGSTGNNTSVPTAQANLFVDDLSYTIAAQVPSLSISYIGNQITLTWDRSGYKLQQRANLAYGEWVDSTDVVSNDGGRFTVSTSLTEIGTFWRLAPQ